ncbi:MAG: ATP synthase F1 subunit gamma [Candidatus Taylorbacteria bacterium RIFCSPLOWO2_12_FULL_43_20]|uniref:ATP synthase gamma chain n=1 Tax=Candidatus Taylorbacteria bacterium RIFCSPLOWO2_12_FULL_43_20 TaxID=1802332 RepID=A0A1G2P1J1_9BACT|nr:MAG: ATP synthase F1 subunit gamma [Candidatus Taylorbacteria bacterium RIFCSPHIGHO2_01_FULL_43_120]OHA23705.1 MAG: ATP synthase F1 subunit gamma [Candidatus Taylorbacteria bacterium RIFCSPHIGHO2_02_FULL_43_55]OHA27958.1 MAG: ATP synthase F1 subunit gamma [Candidatus Taylorbacteria bacterium RIFCSPHIGHO2_12_FULL_42_34]OHA32053.1 MAG: ATP synthase F1 subunit gamma [Candidatus Taylorbacteria bacterium RIFCSPLOWO2_01_FULL_43_83]OHA39803.1 MAG: ATP synthase F1 subunit gamma [Candidatus Taylorbac
MQGTKEIKRRIKSVKSTKKITKAMELVSASKMKRAVASTLLSRLYAEYSWEVLTSLAKNLNEITHPLFEDRSKSSMGGANADRKRILLILITSNRGLCGAYNAQVIKKTLALLKKENNGAEIDVITVGKKGDAAMRRIGMNIIAAFTNLPDRISLRDVTPISSISINEYKKGGYDEILVSYTDFVSALSQKAKIKQILPVSRTELKDTIDSLHVTIDRAPESDVKGQESRETQVDYLIEGDRNKLLESLAEKLTKMQIYQMLLESNASEQSARMMAMKNANEAAGEMIGDLTLVFNKARQSGITREISEISAGMASVT